MILCEVFLRGWLPGLIAGRRHTRAMTLILPGTGWSAILYFNRRGESPSNALRAHERQHVLDWDVFGGWYYARTYLWDILTKGYRRNRWELRAYAVQAEVDPDSLPDWAREDSATMGTQGGSRT